MSDHAGSITDRVRPLLRVRQVREFTDEPPTAEELEAITDVARWSGSSRNSQPWRFIVLRDPAVIRQLAEDGQPQTRALRTAPAAIAIALPTDGTEVSRAYDDGRAAERILIAASFVGLAAGIAWVRGDVRDVIGRRLGLPEGWFVRTIVAVGHPTEAARLPKSAPGEARRPRAEIVFEDRWPGA
jgi:nitroreductase